MSTGPTIVTYNPYERIYTFSDHPSCLQPAPWSSPKKKEINDYKKEFDTENSRHKLAKLKLSQEQEIERLDPFLKKAFVTEKIYTFDDIMQGREFGIHIHK